MSLNIYEIVNFDTGSTEINVISWLILCKAKHTFHFAERIQKAVLHGCDGASYIVVVNFFPCQSLKMLPIILSLETDYLERDSFTAFDRSVLLLRNLFTLVVF